MFVVLECGEPNSLGILGDVLNILTRPKAHIEAKHAFGAAYGVISCNMPKRNADWRRIAILADRYGDRMLMPPNLVPPPPLGRPSFPRFERRILLETAVEIIKLTRMPMYRRVVGLVDETGSYCDYLYPLLHHFTTVKILTQQHQLYSAQSNKMMEELGAPVMICEDYSSFSDCVLIIAPNGISATHRLNCPVLAKNPPASNELSDYITDLQVAVPTEVISACPKMISPHDFLGALYEFCGLELSGFFASKVIYRHSEAELWHIANCVMQASGAANIQ